MIHFFHFPFIWHSFPFSNVNLFRAQHSKHFLRFVCSWKIFLVLGKRVFSYKFFIRNAFNAVHKFLRITATQKSARIDKIRGALKSSKSPQVSTSFYELPRLKKVFKNFEDWQNTKSLHTAAAT